MKHTILFVSAFVFYGVVVYGQSEINFKKVIKYTGDSTVSIVKANLIKDLVNIISDSLSVTEKLWSTVDADFYYRKLYISGAGFNAKLIADSHMSYDSGALNSLKIFLKEDLKLTDVNVYSADSIHYSQFLNAVRTDKHGQPSSVKSFIKSYRPLDDWENLYLHESLLKNRDKNILLPNIYRYINRTIIPIDVFYVDEVRSNIRSYMAVFEIGSNGRSLEITYKLLSLKRADLY